MLMVASWVLSPSSARKTRPKVVRKPRRSMAGEDAGGLAGEQAGACASAPAGPYFAGELDLELMGPLAADAGDVRPLRERGQEAFAQLPVWHVRELLAGEEL